jgi:DNA-binding CsgD family transcriptional regulator
MNLYSYLIASENILNQMPGFIHIVNTEHKIAWANNKVAKLLDFQSADDLIGKDYAHINKICKGYLSLEEIQIIKTNTNLVFKSRESFAFITYHRYADGWKLAFCEKSPLFNESNELIGLINHVTDITNYALIDISRFLFNNDSFNTKAFSYRLEDELSNRYLLSDRQLECLFFLLRGKSDKNTAKILHLSPRTVESYIQEIKFKMQCLTREQIIEKSFREGLLNIFPKSLLKKI